MSGNLRIFHDAQQEDPSSPATVKMRVKQIFPLLMHAHRHNYRWLEDLADDQILVTEDLAEVLREFEEILEAKRGA